MTHSIVDILNRANILYRKVGGKEAVLFEDHRTILNVIYYYKIVNNISTPLNLIFFDYHEDFQPVEQPVLGKLVRASERLSERKLFELVEFELRGLDDNWVKAGMELGLINNCVVFNCAQSDDQFVKEYTTKKFGTKKFYTVGDLTDAMTYPGLLNNPSDNRLRELWDILGLKFDSGRYILTPPAEKYIFNIDLDCFTTKVYESTVAIPSELIVKKFTNSINQKHFYYPDSRCFVIDLIQRAEISAICFESDYCGGIREMQKIFNTIDRLFFNDELGAE